MDSSLAGQTIGDYRIIRELGHGGMGVVYLAEQVHLKKRYALKVLPEELSANPEFVQRFHREARVMAALDHPGIVRVVYFGHHQGIYYLVMDYVEGPGEEPLTLEDHLFDSGGRLPGDDARRIALQVCDALEYAHGFEGKTAGGEKYHGVVHRDLKPANILLDGDMNVRVADFGLARLLGDEYVKSQVERSIAHSISMGIRDTGGAPRSAERPPAAGDAAPSLAGAATAYEAKPEFRKTTTGALLGTYDFMSPEQKRGGVVDIRSDIYALGVVVYQVLTGKKPTGFFKLPSQVNRSLSHRWDEVVKGCLQENPGDRFVSVGDVKRLLEREKPSWLLKSLSIAAVVMLAASLYYVFVHQRPDGPSGPVVVDESSIAGATAELPAEAGPDDTGKQVAEPPVTEMPIENKPVVKSDSSTGSEKTDEPAPPPAAPEGVVLIKTDPVGAEIFCGGISLGSCPAAGIRAEYEPLEYMFRAEMDGYLPAKKSVALEDGRETLLEIKLEPRPGRIAVDSDPSGARVFIDEKEIGLTPYRSEADEIPPDTAHVLLLRRSGYKDSETGFSVGRGEVRDLGVIKLVKAEGTITIETVPPGARVYLPGNRLLGKTPLNNEKLPIGSYKLRIQRDGYEDREITVEITRDRTVSVSESLVETRIVKVRKLLDEAARRIDENKFTTPAGEDALSVYREVLKLDPGNREAVTGIDKIYSYYFTRGESGLASSDFSQARDYFNKCLEVKPTDRIAASKLSEVDRKEQEAKRAEEERKRREAADRMPKSGQMKTVDLGGGVKLELVWVPPGEFTMGSPSSEEGRGSDEKQHRVKITNGFWMGKYEVTQAQFRAFAASSEYRTESERDGYALYWDGSSYQKSEGKSWRNTSYVGDDRPVVYIAWADAAEFCRWLSKKTNETCRLPTEAEWEYACRAGTGTAIYTGSLTIRGKNNGPELDRIAWYGGNSGVGYTYSYGTNSSGWSDKQYNHSKAGPRKVGQKKPNAWGLYDMIGNVWEWCRDWYGSYPGGSVSDPAGPSESGAALMTYKMFGVEQEGKGRVVRGGSWDGNARYCRSAYRYWDSPVYRSLNYGFRIVLSASQD